MNGYWGARVLLLSKKGAGKGWCVFVCVCVGWGGGECITSNDSLNYFSARTFVRKNSVDYPWTTVCPALIFWTKSYFFFFF